MNDSKQKLKPYKEILDKVLYTNDYVLKTDNWKTYPKNRIKVELVDYTWQVEVKWEIRDYQWQKISISNSKIEFQDWQNVIKQKSIKTAYWDRIVKDETVVKITPDEFNEILKHFSKKVEN